MHPRLLALVAVVAPLAAAAIAFQPTGAEQYTTWRTYGGTPDQIRYSTLRQIDRTNVSRLEVAWTYDAKESGGLQTQPIVVDGVLYGNTPSHKVIALNAGTGELLWTFDAMIKSTGANRGLMYWADGADRRVYAAVDQFLYALDAKSGKPASAFGENGRIDLRRDLGRDPAQQSVRLTSPGVVYKDLLIIGGRVSEGLPSSPGDIRAYDARTGQLRWSFHTIPHPGEPGHETWSQESWRENGGANNWPGMALDSARGVVYVPTGSAAADFYGANRAGDNLYANSLIALNADTGARIWHFQFVRHDIWDRDPPSPPSLVTVRHDGREIRAVAQATKQGYVFLFDRVTGKPLFPIEHRKFPPSDVPGEITADTQPMPTKPKAFARELLTEAELTDRTPEAHAWALQEFSRLKNGGPFIPFTVGKQTVIFPGFDGGAEWGGQAFDPETALYYVNANDLPWTGGLAVAEDPNTGRGLYRQYCAACHRDDLAGTPPQIPTIVDVAKKKSRDEIVGIIRKGAGRMAGFPSLVETELSAIVDYVTTGVNATAASDAKKPPVQPFRFTGYRKFLDPDGYPAVVPPWGTLTAINLNTGEFAWRIPFGEYPELAEKGIATTGTENYGGPIVTAGGLVFIGATNFDRKFRAFDKATGKLLWETTLPFSGNATPATFDINGRQFVVIAAGGGKGRQGSPSGSVYVAFALPR